MTQIALQPQPRLLDTDKTFTPQLDTSNGNRTGDRDTPSILGSLLRRAADALWPERLEDPQTQSPLMRLPAELRLQVYHYALIDKDDQNEH